MGKRLHLCGGGLPLLTVLCGLAAAACAAPGTATDPAASAAPSSATPGAAGDPAAQGAGAERVAGTSVSLMPPQGFAPAGQFPGYQKAEVGASILISEFAVPVAELRRGMDARGLASRGMELLESRDTALGGQPVRLLRARQQAGGIDFEKWLLLLGDESSSVLVIASFPQALAELREPLQHALLSVRRNAGAPADPSEGLPFRIAASGDLQIAHRVGHNLTLTRGGTQPPLPPTEPLLVVVTSLRDVPLGNLESAARARLAQTAEIVGVRDVRGAEASVGGLPAYELTAAAHDRRSRTPLRVYQLLVAARGHYFLVQGMVGDASAEEYLPRFAEIAHSLEPANANP